MIINENVEIIGDKIALVPYDKHLVLKYHEWMESSELLATTASEPLTLEQEYEMQESWRKDDDKLTFIALDKNKRNDGDVSAMIGDTNLFINDKGVAEVMIMIAETSYRRKGYGREALLLILRYGIEELAIKKYEAKISKDNAAGIRLFERIGFVLTSESAIFKEITLTKEVDDKFTQELSNINYKTTYREI